MCKRFIGHRFLPPTIALSLLTGCLSQHSVTTRPEFADPKHLVSLCAGPTTLHLSNKGVFTADRGASGKDGYLLLSALLVDGELERHRLYQELLLTVRADASLTITTREPDGLSTLHTYPANDITCTPDGELQLQMHASTRYLWATFANHSSMLTLWGTDAGGLVVQNRWKETVWGVVGGSESGDGWATFTALPATEENPTTERATMANTAANATTGECSSLSDQYSPKAQVIHNDGSLESRTALDQFFRVEIIGEQPVNQQKQPGSRFVITQEPGQGLTLSLFDDQRLLGSRVMEEESVSCKEGRWQIRGKRDISSAWMLITASGGVTWEDLTMWRDPTGDLLVEGVYKSRAAIFLIPVGHTQKLFMIFPKLALSATDTAGPAT